MLGVQHPLDPKSYSLLMSAVNDQQYFWEDGARSCPLFDCCFFRRVERNPPYLSNRHPIKTVNPQSRA